MPRWLSGVSNSGCARRREVPRATNPHPALTRTRTALDITVQMTLVTHWLAFGAIGFSVAIAAGFSARPRPVASAAVLRATGPRAQQAH
jgi:hypothetical protein